MTFILLLITASLQEHWLKEKTRAWHWAFAFLVICLIVYSDPLVEAIMAGPNLFQDYSVSMFALAIAIAVLLYILPFYLCLWLYFSLLRRYSATGNVLLWWAVFLLLPPLVLLVPIFISSLTFALST